MVCVPCIVIPVLLWVFHKFIQPFILKFWNPWEKKSVVNSGVGVDQNGSVMAELEPLNLKDVDKDSAEYKFIEKSIEANPVMVFSKTTCSFCKMAKGVLNDVGVNYAVEEIDKMDNFPAIQDVFQKMTGARSVPRVFIGRKCVGGGTDVWTLHNQKKLVPMMQESGASFKKTN